MDKNNDIKVNKISKWDAAPKSIKNLRNYISESWVNYAAPPCCPPLDPSCQDSICESMMTLLGSVLDDYNELEAKYQEACGMISQYEEENRNLKSELDIKTDECDALISRVFKQDEEYTKLEAENKDLRMTCEPLKKVILKLQDECNSIATENTSLKEENAHLKDRCNKLAYRGALVTENVKLRSECKSKEDVLKKMVQEVTDLEDQLVRQKQETGVMISQYEEENRGLREQRKRLKNAHIKLTGDNDYLRQECDRYIDLLDKLRRALKDKGIRVEWNEAALKWNLYDKTNNTCESCRQHYESEIKQIIELAKSYGLIIYDDRKDAIPDDVVNVGMCGCYYVLGGRVKEESKDVQKLEKKWKNAENTIKELIQVLNYEHIDVSHSKSSWTIHNRALSEKTKHFDTQLHNLREIIRDLKADNTNFQKQIEELTHENRVFQSKNLLNRTYGLTGQIELLNKEIETLKKENNNLKQTLLNILEKLETKVGLCRVHLLDSYEDRAKRIAVEHDKLLIKYENLKAENNNLTTDTKRLSDAVEAWFNKFNDMRHKRDFLKKEYEKLKEINKSCPVACECDNFKPKIHHSYDPLDDFPDVEHS